MIAFVQRIGEALLLSLGMFWQVAWSLVLGFAISGAIQTLVSNQRMRALLGRDGPKEIALATVFGAASSSCSYASAAVMRSMFAKGAALVPSLAFLFSSTNLVIELGVVLWLLTSWQFTLAEWTGGLVMIAVMTLAVKLTYPKKLVEEARDRATHAEAGMDHDLVADGATVWQKLRNPEFRVVFAQHFTMDWQMLWVDLGLGFLIAGFLAEFVPNGAWHALAFSNSPAWVQTIGGAFVGPLIAIFTFVCSIGNVPMAAILWAGGFGFSGVLAFLYADLIVLPLLDVYRKYYGWRMAAYIAVVLFTTMALSAILVDVAFHALHLVPQPNPNVRMQLVHFSFDYTFWLNLAFGAVAAGLAYLGWKHPMMHCHGHGDHGDHGDHDAHDAHDAHEAHDARGVSAAADDESCCHEAESPVAGVAPGGHE